MKKTICPVAKNFTFELICLKINYLTVRFSVRGRVSGCSGGEAAVAAECGRRIVPYGEHILVTFCRCFALPAARGAVRRGRRPRADRAPRMPPGNPPTGGGRMPPDAGGMLARPPTCYTRGCPQLLQC